MSKKRAEREFREASQRLFKRIPKRTCGQLRGLAFPDFDSTTDVDAKIAEIEKTLEGYLSSRREALDPANRSRLQLVTCHIYSLQMVPRSLSFCEDAVGCRQRRR